MRRPSLLPYPPPLTAAAVLDYSPLPCCRALDPEPLKLLKMEMRVALKDEDYAEAARIR